MQRLIYLSLSLFSLIISFLGIFIFLKPEAAIELQRRFYEMINWRIEPVSMARELRNTKIMGMFLITVALITTVYSFVQLSCL